MSDEDISVENSHCKTCGAGTLQQKYWSIAGNSDMQIFRNLNTTVTTNLMHTIDRLHQSFPIADFFCLVTKT